MNYSDNDNDICVSDFIKAVTEVNFQSSLIKTVYKTVFIATILKHIKPLDFPVIYHRDNEKVLYYIHELRNELEACTDKKKKEELWEKLKRYEPAIMVKYSIAVKYLLQVACECGHDLIYMNGLVYCYNGRYWENIKGEIAKAFLAEVMTKTGINEYQMLRAKAQKDLYSQFTSYAYYSSNDMYKNDTVVINLKSKAFCCRDGKYEFRDFDKNDMLTYCLDFDYDPEAKMEDFQKFLDRVLPNKDMQRVLAEYCAYILTKNLKLEKALILLGAGANGKSTFSDIFAALLGRKKNVCYNSLNDLCDPKGYYRTELSNYLLNFCSEFSTNYDAQVLKQLISTEEITARSVFKEPVTISNYCKFIFNANVIGKKDLEQSYGFRRRLLILPFNVTIPESERDPELANKIIKKELSGIFNWVLDGLQRILKNKRFSITPQIEAVADEFERDSDSVALFMQECRYVNDATSKILLKKLFEEYFDYCNDELKMKPVSKPEFKRRLRDNLNFGIKEHGTNNYTYVFCSKKPECSEDVCTIKKRSRNGAFKFGVRYN